jgi:DNA-binding transcriptional LysR family regulator
MYKKADGGGQAVIARLGNFCAASNDLDVSPTAIGSAVARLDNRLSVCLLNRTTRNVALTSAGREYVEAITPALSGIASEIAYRVLKANVSYGKQRGPGAVSTRRD